MVHVHLRPGLSLRLFVAYRREQRCRKYAIVRGEQVGQSIHHGSRPRYLGDQKCYIICPEEREMKKREDKGVILTIDSLDELGCRRGYTCLFI